MPTLAESLVSSSARPVRLRMRPDLTARQHRYHGRTYWVVKEPVGLNYYRFHEEEYAILGMLDGHRSLESIKEDFEREFAPQKITFQDLQQFIGMLHRSGLVISDAAGQGRQLRKRRDEKKRRELIGRVSNIFALRFRGIDPERLLTWLYRYTSWLFAPATVFCCCLLAVSALLLVTVQFDVFRSRLPTFHEFFGPHNWIYLAVVMGVVKVLHEFGHGLSCKHFGGECHEMGAMLLVFTPCLYCNVSDSWMLPNKWHRVIIGAAGMYVEIVLASIATFLWWFSEPGLLNFLCLSVMFICSVSTILFNGNPLLRFDGYYILMDIVEIPNLRQKSTEVLKRFLVWLCLGIEQPENPFLPQKRQFLFGMYTVASAVYRWVVVLSILYFLNQVLEPYGLKIIGQIIGAIGLFGLVVQPLWQLGKFFYIPGRMHKVKPHRVALSLGAVALLLAAVVYLPLPYHVDCVFTVKPRGATNAAVTVPGRLVELRVQPGDDVQADTVLAKLVNPELDMEVEQLEAEKARFEAQLAGLRALQPFDAEAAASQIPQLRELIDGVNELLVDKREQQGELEVRATVAGTVMPPEYREPSPEGEGRLASWSGSPLDDRNLGAALQRNDIICRVGDPQSLEAELVIDQSLIDFVHEGDRVELMLDAYPGRVIEATVEKVGSDALEVVPASLADLLDTVQDESGMVRPLNTSYPARVELDGSEGTLRLGLRGKAKIHTARRSLGDRLHRYISKTFHFEL